MLTLALNLLGAFLPTILQKFGVISPAISDLITKLMSVVPGLAEKLKSGGTPTDDELALLTAFQSEIKVLQASTTLDPEDLAIALAVDSAIEDAITAYQAAEAKDDPSNLTPLPTNVGLTPA